MCGILKFQRRRTGKLRLRVKLLLVAVVLAVFVYYLNHHLSSMIDQVAYHQIHAVGNEMVNQAVSDIIRDSEIDCGKLIELSYDEDNRVTAIRTNAVELNLFKSELTACILEQVREMKTQEIKIPIGSFTGSKFLNARGPDIYFKVYPSGYLNTSVMSTFTSAGMNQTNHRIVLDVSVDIACVGLIGESEVQVKNEYILAETVIVGTVPEQYSELLFKLRSEI